MASALVSHWVEPSLMDRLIPGRISAQVRVNADDLMGVDAYRDTVLFDLHDLLNAVCFPDVINEGASDEVSRSMLTYGLPDLSRLSVSSREDRETIRAAIETAIEIHEPRLSGVRVSDQEVDARERTISLRIDARLYLPPEPDPITIDARLNLESLSCDVKERR